MEKNAVITGTSRGIGRAMLKEFAGHGYNVWACARKQTEDFEKEIAKLKMETGKDIMPVYFDLMNENDVKNAMKIIISDKHSIDVLINNAGVPDGGLMTMTPLSKLREVYEVNVFAQVLMMQLTARRMMRQKRGCIINMCSVGGMEAQPGYLAYGSSKAALIWITKAVSKELGKYNIRVNGIAPGLVDTDMGHFKTAEELKKVQDRMSIGRMASAEEIARAALYIASDDAAYMTGHIMVLDGGRL